jgi:hypothetical protein
MELTADELVAKAKRMSAEVAAFRVQLVTMEEAAGAAHAERVHTAQAADAARQAAKALRLAAAEATRAAKATAALVTIRDAEVAAAVATLVALEEATAAAARAEEESAAKVVTEGQQVDLAAPAGPWQPVDAGRSRELGTKCSWCAKARPLLRGAPPLLRCGRCKQAYYCGRECQTRAWQGHRVACRQAAPAAAATRPCHIDGKEDQTVARRQQAVAEAGRGTVDETAGREAEKQAALEAERTAETERVRDAVQLVLAVGAPEATRQQADHATAEVAEIGAGLGLVPPPPRASAAPVEQRRPNGAATAAVPNAPPGASTRATAGVSVPALRTGSVVQLKEQLGAMGLHTAGKKDALVRRLAAALRAGDGVGGKTSSEGSQSEVDRPAEGAAGHTAADYDALPRRYPRSVVTGCVERLAAGDPRVEELIGSATPVVVRGVVSRLAQAWTWEHLAMALPRGPNAGLSVLSDGGSGGRFKRASEARRNAEGSRHHRPVKVQHHLLDFGEFARASEAAESGGEQYYMQATLLEDGALDREGHVACDFTQASQQLARELEEEPGVRWLAAAAARHGLGTFAKAQLWCSGGRSLSPCHYDVVENLFCQLEGRKRVLLLAPAEWARLYPEPVCSTFDRRATVDLEAVDTARFPRFAEARGVEVILDPGDLLYIPLGWWHHVQQLPGNHNTSVNFWYHRTAPLRGSADMGDSKAAVGGDGGLAPLLFAPEAVGARELAGLRAVQAWAIVALRGGDYAEEQYVDLLRVVSELPAEVLGGAPAHGAPSTVLLARQMRARLVDEGYVKPDHLEAFLKDVVTSLNTEPASS